IHGEEFFDATTATIVDGVMELPDWLSVTCATVGRSAQTGPHTARMGFAANTARAQSRDGKTFTLLLEPPVENHIADQDFSSWTGTAAIAANIQDPAGTTTAFAFEDDDPGVIQERSA